MQETMLQEVMTAPREIRFDRVPVPTAGPGQVLVKIKRIGICGSDIHVYHGKHPYTKYPVTQGHEVSGQVAALGEGVTQFQVGQRVTIEPQVYCGECYPCTHGKYNLCENLKVMGFQTTGTASEYFAVDASKVTALPAGMSYDEGAMLEPLAVTVHAARRAGDVAGKKVCVLGCGPIGILLVQSLKAFGAAEVMATGLEVVASDPQVRAILVNVFGGITSCDTVAQGIVTAVESLGGLPKPVVVRLDGNNADTGRAILADAAIEGVTVVDTMDGAADVVTAIAEKISGRPAGKEA